MTPIEVVMLVAVGLGAGLLGGLFGIGGGIIIVPALYVVFLGQGISEAVAIKLAVGTSLATIIITAIRSVQRHHALGHVVWPTLRRFTPVIGIGAVLGAVVARLATANILLLIFGVGLLVLAIQRLYHRPNTDKLAAGNVLSNPVQRGLGVGIGFFSSLLGIGGGVPGVVVLTRLGESMHRAVGTAAGFGFAVAVPGALSYLILGLFDPLAPGPSVALGYIHWPGFLAIAAGTAVAAPWGASLAGRLSADRLNILFSGYMILTGILMIREALFG